MVVWRDLLWWNVTIRNCLERKKRFPQFFEFPFKINMGRGIKGAFKGLNVTSSPNLNIDWYLVFCLDFKKPQKTNLKIPYFVFINFLEIERSIHRKKKLHSVDCYIRRLKKVFDGCFRFFYYCQTISLLFEKHKNKKQF